MTAPQIPLNLVPVNLGYATSSDFLVSASLRPWSGQQRAEFQIATDVGFTANLHTVFSDWRTHGSATASVGAPRLPQGDVWVRVRSVDLASGDASLWSSANRVTVTHPGTARLDSPGQGASIPWVGGNVTFDWTFRDSSALDSQSAYRLVVSKDDGDNTYEAMASAYSSYSSVAALNDDYADTMGSGGAAVLFDSGKVTSAVQTRTATIPGTGRNEVIRWTIQTWDQDDISGGPTVPNFLFVGDAPVVTITAPLTTTDTPMPTITWTYSSAAGHAQGAYRVWFQDVATGRRIFDSGQIVGASTVYVPPAQILKNNEQVIVTVEVYSSIGVVSRDTETLMPTWLAPPNANFDIVTTNHVGANRVDLEWFGSPQDPTFVEWRVYRRARPEDPWIFLGATEENYFMDHNAPPLATVEYSVTQAGVRFDAVVESQLIPIGVDLSTSYYMLKVKDEPGLAMLLQIVTEDTFEHQYEETVLDIIGGGRKAEIGDKFGIAGSLTVHFRDMGLEGHAGDLYDALVSIKDAKTACYLRVPHKDTLEVHIGNLSVTRVPGVATDISDISFSYTQVA